MPRRKHYRDRRRQLSQADSLLFELGPLAALEDDETVRLEAVWAVFGARWLEERGNVRGEPWALSAYGPPE